MNTNVPPISCETETSEPTFRSILEHSPDGIVLTNERGDIIDWNRGAEQITGLSRAEALGQPLWEVQFSMLPKELQTSDAYERSKAAFQGLLITNHPPWLDQPHTHEICSRDGTKRIIQSRVFAVTMGPDLRFGGILRDVTEISLAEKSLKETLDWQRAIFEGSLDAIFISDTESRLVAVNPAACELTGYQEGELLNMRIPDLYDEVDLALYQSSHTRIMNGEDITNEVKIRRKDGQEVDTEFNNRRIMISGTPYIHTVARDITDRKRGEEALRENENRFRDLAENIREVFWIFDWREQKVLYVSPAYEEIWGRSAQALLEDYEEWAQSVYPADREFADESFQRIVETGGGESREYRITRPDGTIRWMSDRGFAVFDDHGEVLRIVGIAEDITERKEVEDRLLELATRDFLTKLPNRRSFHDHLDHALSRARRQSLSLALLYLDLDGFKIINDSFGHMNGDKVLKNVADRLKGCFRDSDFVARLGGDEFAIIMEGIVQVGDVEVVAKKAAACFSHPFRFDEQHANLTASIGISIFPQDTQNSQSLLKYADNAMYMAKEQGKNQICFYGHQTDERSSV